jgi:hypothetical protein
MWQNQGIQGGAGSDDRRLIEVIGSRFDRLSPIADRGHPLGAQSRFALDASPGRADAGRQLYQIIEILRSLRWAPGARS